MVAKRKCPYCKAEIAYRTKGGKNKVRLKSLFFEDGGSVETVCSGCGETIPLDFLQVDQKRYDKAEPRFILRRS